jgi:hypothetical protein
MLRSVAPRPRLTSFKAYFALTGVRTDSSHDKMMKALAPHKTKLNSSIERIARERIEVHQAAEDFERAWLNFITACTRLRTLSFCMMFVM